MTFADRIAQGVAEFRAATATLANPSGWLTTALAGPKTSSGQRVTVNKALGMSPVFSAVSIISEQIGMLPFKVFKELDQEGALTEARSHRAWRMLHDKPNAATDAHRYWATVAVQLLLWGNAFIEKRRSPGSLFVDELWLLDPAKTTVWFNRDTGEKQFVEQTDRGRRRYDDGQVLHIFGLSTDGIVGRSPIQTCRESFGTAMAREQFEGEFYARGAVHQGVLEHPDTVGPEAIKELRKSWDKVYGGKAHEVVILEEGLKFRPTTIPLADLEFVASTQMSRTDIATLFRLPPSYLGGSTGDSLTYATVEGNQIQLATLAVAPWTNCIGQAITNDPSILPLPSFKAEFELKAMMRGDEAARGTFYGQLDQVDAITPNEVRAREGMPPRAGGDKTRSEREAEAAEAAAEASKTEPPPGEPEDEPAEPTNGRVPIGFVA